MSVKAVAVESLAGDLRGRAADYAQLTKPRVVSMVLVTTLAGFYLGGRTGFDFTLAFNLLLATALAAAGTMALNQYVERDTDALMERTRRRPLPGGRMRPIEALVFGVGLSAAGFVYLALATNWLCTAITAAITIIYLGAYTPLKRVSWVCDVIGAIPGALPPVAGWAAARGQLSTLPWLMFATMFLWQLPHTFAVARLYRNDYKRASIHLLPDDREDGSNPSNLVVIAACLGLVAVGVAPTLIGEAGMISAVIAGLLGMAMLVSGTSMVRQPAKPSAARRLLFTSLFYLPIVLLALVLDRV